MAAHRLAAAGGLAANPPPPIAPTHKHERSQKPITGMRRAHALTTVINQAHDRLFRSTFRRPEHAVGVLTSALPATVAGEIDWTTLEPQSGSLVGEDLSERICDLLYSVRLRDGAEVFVYVLFEHQSTVEPRMVVRVLGYMQRIWDECFDDDGARTRLPGILPLVLYHGEHAWNAATALDELLDLQPPQMAAFGPHLPLFRFVLEDLSVSGTDSLQRRHMSELARLVLFCLARARSSGFADEIATHAALFVAVYETPRDRGPFNRVLHYISKVNEEEPGAIETVLGDHVGLEAREAFVTIEQRLIEKGMKQGQRLLLLKQLRAKFGELPTSAQDRIGSASPAELDRWGEGILTATSLDELFA